MPTGPSSERRFLLARLENHFSSHYQLIVAIFKGVTLFNGVVALQAILSTHDGPSDLRWKWVALAFWVASFASIILTYDAILVATLIVTQEPNALDIVLPFIIGLMEFMQFSVLQPLTAEAGVVPSVAQQLEHLTWWPLTHALLATTASLVMMNTQRQLTANLGRLPGDMQVLFRSYKRGLRVDQAFVAVNAAILYLAFVALRNGLPGAERLESLPDLATLREYQGLIGVTTLVGMAVGIRNQERARRHIADGLAA